MASLSLHIAESPVWTIVPRRTTDDLPAELKDGTNFSNARNDHGYTVLRGTRQVAVEYINHRWHYLEQDRQTGNFLTRPDLALTLQQLQQHRLANESAPPETNILEHRDQQREQTLSPEQSTTFRNEEGWYESVEPVTQPIAPQEELFISEALTHVATLKHANHPADPPDQAAHIRPHMTTIQAAIQEGMSIPHEPPTMISNPEEINVTIAPQMAPNVPPKEPAGTSKALLSPPEPFSGDRAKAEDFLQDFELCRRLNRTHPTILLPYDRVMVALSYMRGNTAVKNWVRHEMGIMDHLTSVANEKGPISYGNEKLWRRFTEDFRDAFANTTKQQDAEAALERIHVQPQESIDQYIARFEDLIDKAGWSPLDRGTANVFRKGLHDAMQKAIFLKDPIPTTLLEWKEAARKEASRYALMKSAGMFQKKTQGPTNPGQRFQNPAAQRRWGRHFQNNGGKKDPNAMDIDTIQVNALSPDEKQRLVKEGRCFRCKNTGHLSKQCPMKTTENQRTGQFVTNTQRALARTTEVIDDRDTEDEDRTSTITTEDTRTDTIRTIQTMSPEEQLALIDEIFKDKEDF